MGPGWIKPFRTFSHRKSSLPENKFSRHQTNFHSGKKGCFGSFDNQRIKSDSQNPKDKTWPKFCCTVLSEYRMKTWKYTLQSSRGYYFNRWCGGRRRRLEGTTSRMRRNLEASMEEEDDIEEYRRIITLWSSKVLGGGRTALQRRQEENRCIGRGFSGSGRVVAGKKQEPKCDWLKDEEDCTV